MEDDYDLSKLIKKKKKRVNSRRKGNSFELQTCKLLNKTVDTKEFIRTPGSGAFASTHTLPEHLNIYGDIITPKTFKYTIECKKGYNKEDIYSLLYYRSDFWKFIEQSEKDAQGSGLEPLLIFKQDRKAALAVARKESFGYLEPSVDLKEYRMYLLEDLLKLDRFYWFTDF